jgi:hypothetical protein
MFPLALYFRLPAQIKNNDSGKILRIARNSRPKFWRETRIFSFHRVEQSRLPATAKAKLPSLRPLDRTDCELLLSGIEVWHEVAAKATGRM